MLRPMIGRSSSWRAGKSHRRGESLPTPSRLATFLFGDGGEEAKNHPELRQREAVEAETLHDLRQQRETSRRGHRTPCATARGTRIERSLAHHQEPKGEKQESQDAGLGQQTEPQALGVCIRLGLGSKDV